MRRQAATAASPPISPGVTGSPRRVRRAGTTSRASRLLQSADTRPEGPAGSQERNRTRRSQWWRGCLAGATSRCTPRPVTHTGSPPVSSRSRNLSHQRSQHPQLTHPLLNKIPKPVNLSLSRPQLLPRSRIPTRNRVRVPLPSRFHPPFCRSILTHPTIRVQRHLSQIPRRQLAFLIQRRKFRVRCKFHAVTSSGMKPSGSGMVPLPLRYRSRAAVSAPFNSVRIRK